MPSPTEAQTRADLIDPALEQAGWDLANPDQVGIEIPVDGFDPAAWQALETELRRLRDELLRADAELRSSKRGRLSLRWRLRHPDRLRRELRRHQHKHQPLRRLWHPVRGRPERLAELRRRRLRLLL